MKLSFRQYLQEDAISIEDLIKRDCGPWLAAAGGTEVYRGVNIHGGDLKLAGLKRVDPASHNIYKTQTLVDRVPRDSPMWLHNAMDKYFESKSGVKFRSNSVFVTPDLGVAQSYADSGEIFTIYPIGKFSYCWSPIIDDPTDALVSSITDGNNLHLDRPEFNNLLREFYKQNHSKYKLEEEKLDEYLEQLSPSERSAITKANSPWAKLISDFINDSDMWLFNKGLKRILANKKFSTHELMISCEEYYLVRPRTLKQTIIKI